MRRVLQTDELQTAWSRFRSVPFSKWRPCFWLDWVRTDAVESKFYTMESNRPWQGIEKMYGWCQCIKIVSYPTDFLTAKDVPVTEPLHHRIMALISVVNYWHGCFQLVQQLIFHLTRGYMKCSWLSPIAVSTFTVSDDVWLIICHLVARRCCLLTQIHQLYLYTISIRSDRHFVL